MIEAGHIKKTVILLIILLLAIPLSSSVLALNPTLSYAVPIDESIGISLQPVCSVTVNDDDGNNSIVYFYTSSDNSTWTLVQTSYSILNESVEFDYTVANGYNTRYYWKVTAVNNDDETANISEIYYFTTAVEDTSDIEIYPPVPRAGDSLAVILKKGHEGKDADGLLYCNGNLYAFSISNGMGVVALDKHDYGTATLRIFSKDFSPTEITKTITIKQPSTNNVRFLTSSTAVINKETSAVLRFNQEPLPDFEVKLKSPDGKESYAITDGNGKIYVTLDSVGIWSFDANVYGNTITAMTSVIYEPILLSVIGTPSVGVETTITTEPYASVEIFLEGEMIDQYIASPQGTVEFIPEVGGFYEILSRTGSKKGTYVIEVADTANIKILDALTTLPATNFEKGRVYQIIVSNNAGIVLDTVEILYITTPFATTEILSLIGGKTTWMPHLTGSYLFTIEATEMCAEASQYVVVKKPMVEGGDIVVPVITATVLIIIIIAMFIIYYCHHNKIPIKNIFKNIKLGKKKISLPFD